MPKEDKQRITGLPTVNPVSDPQALRVVARPVDQTVMPSAQDGIISQLVSGLASINPQLQQYVQQKNTTDLVAADQQGTTAAEKRTFEGLDPNRAILGPDAMPEGIEPAFHQAYRNGYRKVIGAKMADKLQADALNAWAEERVKVQKDGATGMELTPGEAAEEFLKKWVAENASGFDDPLILAPVTQRLMETAKAIRSDARNLGMQQYERSVREGVNASFSQISPDMPVDQMMDTFFSKIVPTAMETSFYSRTELNALLVERVRAMSAAMGGRPELFDMLKEQKDPSTGKSIYDLNPQMAAQIDGLRREADAQVSQKLEKAMQPIHFQTHMKWTQEAAAGNPPTMERIISEMGTMGMYKSYGAAVSAYLSFQQMGDAARGEAYAMSLFQGGNGAMLSEADQKKHIDKVTSPIVSELFAASNDPAGAERFNMAAGQIIQVHKESKVSVPNTQLKNLFGTIQQSMPAQGEIPSPQFKALANLYSQLPDNLRSAYVTDENTHLILSRYNEARSGGPQTQVSEAAALFGAYQSVSKEAQEASKRILGTTEGREKLRETLDNLFSVVGWRAFNPFASTVANEEFVTDQVKNATRGYIERMGGSVSDKEAMEWGKRWFTDNYVYDSKANRYVAIPPAKGASESTADAISEFTEKMVAKWGKDADPHLIHIGNGVYQVRSPQFGQEILQTTTLDEIKADHYALKNLDPRSNEPQRLQVLQRALNDGTITNEQLTSEADLIAKAKVTKSWNADMFKKVDEARKRAFEQGLSPILKDVPKGSMDGVDTSRLPSNGTNLKVDVATLYKDQGSFGKAMTVLGEGVVLKRYTDTAGVDTIGIGYNIPANARTIAEDFRRAGIPADALEDIKAGKKSITKEQAVRLFEISYNRAEMSARSSIEKIYGKGSWDKLAFNRKAVLTDLAFNVGSVDQFKPTLDRFINEIGSIDSQNPVVHYRDATTKQMVPLKGRNNLRLALLNGERSIHGILGHISGTPRNKIEAQALLNPPK